MPFDTLVPAATAFPGHNITGIKMPRWTTASISLNFNPVGGIQGPGTPRTGANTARQTLCLRKAMCSHQHGKFRRLLLLVRHAEEN